MRRAIVPLVATLALLTGVTIAETRRAIVAPTIPGWADGRAGANTEIVRAFYAAINDALATGDTRGLDGVLDPGLVEHPARLDAAPGRDGLLAAIQSLRAVSPEVRLTPRDFVAQGDRVGVWVDTGGADDALFLGHPLEGARFWGTVDLFRIDRGRIVEYWRDPATGVVADLMPAVTFSLDDPMISLTSVFRATYPAGATETARIDRGAVILLVEAGALTVSVDGAAAARRFSRAAGSASEGESLDRGARASIIGGEAIVISGRTTVTIHNEGIDPANALLLFTRVPPAERGAVTPEFSGSTAGAVVSRSLLAGGVSVLLPRGEITVRFGRIRRSPGSALGAAPVGIAEFAAVEDGEAAVLLDGVEVWMTSPSGGGQDESDGRTIPRGGGIVATGGGTIDYEVVGSSPLAGSVAVSSSNRGTIGYQAIGSSPLSLLLVTITASSDTI